MSIISVPFQIGDRVVYTAVSSKYNMEATVVAIMGADIGIAFDKPVGSHDCAGNCEDQHGWWTHGCNLRLVGRNKLYKKYSIVSAHVNPERRLVDHGKQAR